jgi:cystathionine beta-lyase/cystathionine gamma-synthase
VSFDEFWFFHECSTFVIAMLTTDTFEYFHSIPCCCRVTDRTFVTRDIKTPDPVPVAGQEAALELMKAGRMYRYNVASAEQSTVSQCEKEIAEYTGHKYCVALNSCGSALMLLLKCAGLKPGGEVLSNAFTFGAVPSAIEHAGGKVRFLLNTVTSSRISCKFLVKANFHQIV